MMLSIAVAAKGLCDPKCFLDSLMQERLTDNEYVSIHIAHDESWDYLPAACPSNIHLHHCKQGTAILKLWGTVIARSNSDYIAVLDINCPPQKGWSRRVLKEMNKQTPVFFGAVEPGWGLNDLRILGYITEYAQFKSPLPAHGDEVPGNNIVFKRCLLDDGSDVEETGFYKTFMIWRLEKELGIRACGFNDMPVSYYKPFSYKHYMFRRYVHGRCFAACRFDNAGQPPRWACLLFSVLLPLLRVWRIYQAVKRNTELKKSFYRFGFFIIQSEVAWSMGEMLGYGLGGKEFCSRLD